MIAKDLAEQIQDLGSVVATQRIPLKVQIGSRFYDLEDVVSLNVAEKALVVKVKKKAKNVQDK